LQCILCVNAEEFYRHFTDLEPAGKDNKRRSTFAIILPA